MDVDGYPDEQELEFIEKWDYRDICSLIEFIKQRWEYAEWGFKIDKGKDWLHGNELVQKIEMHTAGWSGNESLIYALLRNRMATLMLDYRMWKSGGHYYFEFNPKRAGFKRVTELSKELKVSRQSIHRSDKYEFYSIGKIKYARLKQKID